MSEIKGKILQGDRQLATVAGIWNERVQLSMPDGRSELLWEVTDTVRKVGVGHVGCCVDCVMCAHAVQARLPRFLPSKDCLDAKESTRYA
jgi:hypothetical protein